MLGTGANLAARYEDTLKVLRAAIHQHKKLITKWEYPSPERDVTWVPVIFLLTYAYPYI